MLLSLTAVSNPSSCSVHNSKFCNQHEIQRFGKQNFYTDSCFESCYWAKIWGSENIWSLSKTFTPKWGAFSYFWVTSEHEVGKSPEIILKEACSVNMVFL